ncbi:MAG: hypothetical protein ACU83V_03500 [Gammaproteobacteria bacterium]
MRVSDRQLQLLPSFELTCFHDITAIEPLHFAGCAVLCQASGNAVKHSRRINSVGKVRQAMSLPAIASDLFIRPGDNLSCLEHIEKQNILTDLIEFFDVLANFLHFFRAHSAQQSTKTNYFDTLLFFEAVPETRARAG